MEEITSSDGCYWSKQWILLLVLVCTPHCCFLVHVCMHLSSKAKSMLQLLTGILFHYSFSLVEEEQQLWWVCVSGSWEREHLRLICNVLWKVHNFGAFTSELCSSTLLSLWANWTIRAVLYDCVCLLGKQIKHHTSLLTKGRKKHCATRLSNTIAESWIQKLFRDDIQWV